MKTIINKKEYEINNLYYIGVSGDDSNDGLTKSTAFKTLKKAVSVCAEGDGIEFLPGEYFFGNGDMCLYNGSYHISAIGSSVGITFFASSLGSVKVYFNMDMSTISKRPCLFLLAKNTNILNLVINYTNNYTNTSTYYFNSMIGYNSFGTVENCAFVLDSPAPMMFCHSNEVTKMNVTNCNFVNLCNWTPSNYSAKGKTVDKCVFSSQPPTASDLTMTNTLVTDSLTVNTLLKPYWLDDVRVGAIAHSYYILNKGNFYSASETYYDSSTNSYAALSSLETEIPYCDGLCDRPSYLNGLRPIDLFDGDIQMIYKDACICSINGIKSTKELVVATGDINKELAQTINSIIVESVKTNNGTLKLAVSIDKGKTWKTYDGAIWVDLSITIPSTEYSIMTTDEKLQWNNARDVIASKGIYTSIFNSIDFNTLTDDNTTPGYLRFAYVLIRPAYTDNVKTTKLNWDFNAKGNMDLMIPGTEYNLSLYEKEAKFTSLIDNELVKVNFLI